MYDYYVVCNAEGIPLAKFCFRSSLNEFLKLPVNKLLKVKRFSLGAHLATAEAPC